MLEAALNPRFGRLSPNAHVVGHHSSPDARRAAGGNHVEVMNYLIEKGASVDQADKSGRTALHWAAISGHKEATDVLLGKVRQFPATTVCSAGIG